MLAVSTPFYSRTNSDSTRVGGMEEQGGPARAVLIVQPLTRIILGLGIAGDVASPVAQCTVTASCHRATHAMTSPPPHCPEDWRRFSGRGECSRAVPYLDLLRFLVAVRVPRLDISMTKRFLARRSVQFAVFSCVA